MHINPYGTYAVQLGVDLLNSPPTSADELGHRCIEGGLVLDAPATDADVTATVAFLREWEAVIDADTEQARAGILNGLLAQASAYPRLTNHAGDGWHMHYRDPDIDLGS
ncbi:MAG: ABATE domain-containing protein, partial [Rhodococcus fascians]